MKIKSVIFLLITVLLLSACGKEKVEGSLTLLDQDKQQVTFPSEKPTLFFFITTYT